MRTILAGALLATTTLAWAGGADLVGTWTGKADGDRIVLDLKADGTGTLNGDPIQYQTLGKALLISIGGDLVTYGFEQKGDTLTVGGGTLDQPMTMKRGAKGAAVASTAPPSGTAGAGPGAGPATGSVRPDLAGKWCYVGTFQNINGGGSQSSRCFVLGADGTYQYHSESSMSAYSGPNSSGMWGGTSSSSDDAGRWSVAGGTLTAQSRSGAVNRYPLQLRNHPKTRDPMICLDGDCYVTQYQKPSW